MVSDVWSCVMCSLSIGLSVVWTVQQLSCSGVTGLCVCVLVLVLTLGLAVEWVC